MRTTGDRVVVRPIPGEEVTKSGLTIPLSAQKSKHADVIMIGEDPAIRCKPGDLVLFPDQAGYPFEHNNVECKIIRWGDVQLILDRDQKTAEEHVREITQDPGVECVISVLEEIQFGTVNQRLKVLIRPQGKDGITKDFELQGNFLIPT